jgi:hypothetical protein
MFLRSVPWNISANVDPLVGKSTLTLDCIFTVLSIQDDFITVDQRNILGKVLDERLDLLVRRSNAFTLNYESAILRQ